MSPGQIIEVLLIGGIVGLLPGLFGVGGGFVTVPALHLLAGIPLNIAVGSVACNMLGPGTTGLLHRHGRRQLELQMPLTMSGGVIVGVFLGIAFLEWAKHEGSARLDLVLFSCYFVLLLVLAAVLTLEWYVSGTKPLKSRRGWLEPMGLPLAVPFREIDGRLASLPVVTTLAIMVSFLNTGLGMGGGVLIVPALVFLVGVPTHRAVTVSLVISCMTGAFGTVGHALHGNIDLSLVCLLLVGGAFGAKLGSQIGEKLSGRRLRGFFSLLIVAVAVAVGIKLWNTIQSQAAAAADPTATSVEASEELPRHSAPEKQEGKTSAEPAAS